jgi:hypothetical protein
MKKRWLSLIVVVTLLFFVAVMTILVWLFPNPKENPVARWLPWPIVCSTQGCITTWGWADYIELTERFARKAEVPELTTTELLTTMSRQHLVDHAQLKSPVSIEEATRYRRDILNLTDDDVLLYSGLSPMEYDSRVVLPLLRQENLRQYRHAETLTDLYQILAQERRVVVLPLTMQWDKNDGSVKSRE